MAKSSINIQNINYQSYEHNHRKYTPKYAIDSADKNEYYSYLEDNYKKTVKNKFGEYEKIDFDKIKKVLQENYTKTTGQKPQEKTQYFKEAVINTDTHITKKHFDQLVDTLYKKYKITIIDVAHHKDEGRIENNEKVYNYHAHLIFINADENGKTIKWDKQKLRDLQTTVAECLEMERGQDKRISRVERIEHKEYKATQQKINTELSAHKRVKRLDNIVKNQLNEKIEVLKNENSELKNKLGNFDNLAQDNKYYCEKLDNLQQLFDSMNIDINVYSNNDNEEIKKKLMEKIEEEYKQKREELKASGIAKQQDYSNLKKQKEAIFNVLSDTTKPAEPATKTQTINRKTEQIDIG